MLLVDVLLLLLLIQITPNLVLQIPKVRRGVLDIQNMVVSWNLESFQCDIFYDKGHLNLFIFNMNAYV